RLAEEATQRISAVVTEDKRLTIVLAAAETGKCRVFIISNWERSNGPSSRTASHSLSWWEVGLKFPVLLINGCDPAVPRPARRYVIRLLQGGAHPRVVRQALANINRSAASNPKWSALISEECWVH